MTNERVSSGIQASQTQRTRGRTADVHDRPNQSPTTMKEIVIPMPVGMDSDATDRVKRLAATHWGGFTETTARGGWRAPNGETVTETVNVLTVLADESDCDATPEQWARTTARVLAENTDETEVMWFVRNVAAAGFETGDL